MLLRFLEQLEHRAEPLLPKSRFYRRAVWSGLIGGTMYAVTLAVGMVGFVVLEQQPLLDAAVNSSMLMSQLGHVTEIRSTGTKVFLLFYGPFASIGFFGGIGVLFMPWFHRALHRFHAEPPIDRRRS